MAESQPGYGSAHQDFLQWKCRTDIHKKGCRGPENIIGHTYISENALKKKLTKERIELLLEEFRDLDQPALNADYVRTHYLRPFAILLSAGYGHMISFVVKHQSLQDHFLPFLNEPKGFPKLTTGDLFQVFYKEQWQFCAVKLEFDIDYNLENDYILPILDKTEVGHGGSAVLYKIIVDEAYNALVPNQHTDAPATRMISNTFALKTYRTSEAETYYRQERNAFLKLRSGGLPPANIIEFYGSFVRDGIYNIILEYANRGTLDEYMKATPEPKSVSDIMTFWDRFFTIMKGLVHIHGTIGSVPEEQNMLLGWRQDITPENILVVSRNKDSPYDCDFKIADLGLAHFKRYKSSLHDATGATADDVYGTNSYGAPETYRSRDSEKLHLQVSQKVDIWSMGCIFSEVATWVTEGHRKIREYRRRRGLEIREKREIAGEHFHCDWEILHAVSQIHTEIMENCRRNDHITPFVIQKLVDGMMLIDPHSRATAQVFLSQSRRIHHEAQKKLRGMIPSRETAPTPDHTVSDTILEGKKRMPPNLPPDHGRLILWDSPGTESHVSSPGQIHMSPNTIPLSQQRNFSGGFPQNFVTQSSMQIPKMPDEYTNPDYSRALAVQDQESHPSPRRPERGVSYPFGSPVGSSVPNQQQHGHPFRNAGMVSPLLQINTTGTATGLRGNAQPSRQPSQTREDRVMPTDWPTHRSLKGQGASQAPGYRGPDPFIESAMASPELQPMTSTANAESPSFGTPKRNLQPRPLMSVEDGLSVKRAKAMGKSAMFPGYEKMSHTMNAMMKYRDHAFLVDNAESMRNHRQKVRDVLELLSFITHGYDPDGLDLYFSTQSERLRPKTPDQVLKYFDERPAHGLPDMRARFASIIVQYQDRFGERNILKRLLHPNSTPSKGPRRLTLYVLTDGVWQPGCTLITEIKNLVTLIQKHNVPNKHVGIQFIRFGNNPEGIQRLQTLDAGLGLELDIIDTTPADGDVWKMLLGAINDWLDGDHDAANHAEKSLATRAV